MEGKINLFDVLNSTMTYVSAKKPSGLLPFRGQFPLLQPWQEDAFRKGTNGKHYLEECEPWIQSILIKAQHIADVERGFEKYLYENGINQEYMKMNGKAKAAEITRFLSANSLTVDDLIIGGRNAYSEPQ